MKEQIARCSTVIHAIHTKDIKEFGSAISIDHTNLVGNPAWMTSVAWLKSAGYTEWDYFYDGVSVGSDSENDITLHSSSNKGYFEIFSERWGCTGYTKFECKAYY